ncbi:hypothetical protein ZOSMA_27G01320 [Zostera marina]|uniref:AtPDCT1/2 transmembrane domain-containing protein n=1 Tax=Zostera marina TaxID=29655 RepID=A0A0K9PDE4_ZOSMR|nr:hypothetical protein ZOSMA_27G01320 [Zostera marina]
MSTCRGILGYSTQLPLPKDFLGSGMDFPLGNLPFFLFFSGHVAGALIVSLDMRRLGRNQMAFLFDTLNLLQALRLLITRGHYTIDLAVGVGAGIFFDSLAVHLASEAKVAGPVHYRWMYPIERYLLTWKKYVRTRRHPEGSIAEKYLADESMTFCSRFLHNVETKSNRTERYIDGYYGASTHTSLTKLEHGQVHRYIIFNLDIIEIFRNLHIEDLKQRENLITAGQPLVIDVSMKD